MFGQNQQRENLTMTSDIIAIWAGVFGLVYLAGAGLYFEVTSTGKRKLSKRWLQRHSRPQLIRVRHSR